MNWTCCVLFIIIGGLPCATAILINNDNRQTCLRDGKTLKVVLYTKFCPLCDKQEIASALGQLRINFTCIFKVFQIALVDSRLGQFCENFENTREINANAITFTYLAFIFGMIGWLTETLTFLLTDRWVKIVKNLRKAYFWKGIGKSTGLPSENSNWTHTVIFYAAPEISRPVWNFLSNTMQVSGLILPEVTSESWSTTGKPVNYLFIIHMKTSILIGWEQCSLSVTPMQKCNTGAKKV